MTIVPAVASHLPSGENMAVETPLVWPLRVYRSTKPGPGFSAMFNCDSKTPPFIIYTRSLNMEACNTVIPTWNVTFDRDDTIEVKMESPNLVQKRP